MLKVKEHGVNINLTLIDTPGFGGELDNTNWFARLTFPPLVF